MFLTVLVISTNPYSNVIGMSNGTEKQTKLFSFFFNNFTCFEDQIWRAGIYYTQFIQLVINTHAHNFSQIIGRIEWVINNICKRKTLKHKANHMIRKIVCSIYLWAVHQKTIKSGQCYWCIMSNDFCIYIEKECV